MEKNIRIASYNIDGLPDTIDLKELPWVLKPVTWVYKLIKGTTVVTVNDGGRKAECMRHIGQLLKDAEADVIGVQEDFNYHDVLCSELKDYSCGTYSSGFHPSTILRDVECWSSFPLPRFKADGLNLFVRGSRVEILEEDIVRWGKSYGYISHANDKLTHKGFRRFSIEVDRDVKVDVYVLHMDADFYDPVKCPDVSKDVEARKSQLIQLVGYISDRASFGICRPVIIMGDTNCCGKYEWDRNNLQENLVSPINTIPHLTIKEAAPEGGSDLDRIYYINDSRLPYRVEPVGCKYISSYNKEMGCDISDHPLLIGDFIIK